MLVINSAPESATESIEKAIVDNRISVTDSFKNTSGKLVMVCDSEDSRERLKTAIESLGKNHRLRLLVSISNTRKKRS